MSYTTVTCQEELDAALAASAGCIHIVSPVGVWLRIISNGLRQQPGARWHEHAGRLQRLIEACTQPGVRGGDRP